MLEDLKAQLLELHKRIEDEKEQELTELLMKIRGDDIESDRDKNNDFSITNLALHCLTVDLECQLIKNGYEEFNADVEKDIFEILNLVQKCEFTWKMTKDVISDTIDLLCAICHTEESILQKNMSTYVPKWIRDNRMMTENMYYLFTDVANKLIEIGFLPVACHLIRNMCAFSRKRNKVRIHQELVTRVLNIVESDSETVCQICSIDEKSFGESINDYAADFYWKYACALLRLQNIVSSKYYYDKCYVLRRNLYGENDWLTVRARRNVEFYEYSLLNTLSSKEYLLSFVFNIENNVYEIPEDSSIVDLIEAETVWALLAGITREFDNTDSLSEYEALMVIYERICYKYKDSDNPCISWRFAWNFRGNYHVLSEDYILAEKEFQNALSVKASKEEREVLSDEQIKSNLLLVYEVENDIEKSLSLFSELLNIIDEDESGEVVNKADQIRIYAMLIGRYMESDVELEEEEIAEIKRFLHSRCETITRQKKTATDSYAEDAVLIETAAIFFMQSNVTDFQEQQLYLKTLSYIEHDPSKYKMSMQQKYWLFHVKALLAWNLGLPEVEKYFEKYLTGMQDIDIASINKAMMYQSAAAYYGKHGKYNLSFYYSNCAMKNLTDMWHKCIKYSNDSRLVQILQPVHKIYSAIYAIMRNHPDVEVGYDSVIKFKALASLAGRERNRIIQETGFDTYLIKKIVSLQNKLADMQTKNIFLDDDIEVNNMEVQLRNLETEFAMKFPENSTFVDATIELVKENVQDNSLVIEFVLTVNDFGQTQFENTHQANQTDIFDVYILKKVEGCLSTKRIVLNNAFDIIDKAERFIGILQGMSSNESVDNGQSDLEELRIHLYNLLIKPIIHDIEVSETIYIAPDIGLINLPFELLYDGERWDFEHIILKIECVRDLLFKSDDSESTKQGLVIGNPDYEVKEQVKISEKTTTKEQSRKVEVDLSKIESLPFAEIEAKRVAMYLNTIPFIGACASKEKILNAHGYKNIHIATHGFFDLEGQTESIYSSCILVAGVKNWYENNEVSEQYGNGILTADEISRIDLHTTNLVVLSSCLNGMNDNIVNKGFQGMIGAFAAAGVSYVIAHLWNTPESISTVMLMDTFYYYYVEKKMSPPTALAKAKEYLRTITVDKMKTQGWFDYVRNNKIPYTYQKDMDLLESSNDRFRPFKNEIYWGGFTCYRCN